MLPVYRAISFQGVIEKGGRTKPWLVLVKIADQLRPFVVKVFETQLIQTRDSVTNEVLGNVLAQQFDLPVPAAAFIEMDEDFKSTINDHRALEALDERDERMKFGSELLDGFVQMNPSLFGNMQAKKLVDIDSVFAFDNLIRNRDRNSAKPNLLVKNDDFYLIDHELGFEITPGTISELQRLEWDERFYRYHIFFQYLKDSWRKSKEQYFDLFGEYLRHLNVNTLQSYFTQLSNFGYSTEKHAVISNYMNQLKQNWPNFVNLMRGIIS